MFVSRGSVDISHPAAAWHLAHGPRSMTLIGVTKPQCVNSSAPVPHISVHELGSIGSGNGLSPVRRKAITSTNADVLSIRPPEGQMTVKFKILTFPFKKPRSKMSSTKSRPFCPGWDWLEYIEVYIPAFLYIKCQCVDNISLFTSCYDCMTHLTAARWNGELISNFIAHVIM